MADKFNATPGAIQLIEANKLDPAKIKGTGNGGLILKSDVEAFMKGADEKKNDKAELAAAQAEVAKENAKKAKENKNQKATEAKRKKEADAKKKALQEKKDAEKKSREEAKAKKKAEADERKKVREAAAAEAAAAKKEKDANAFKQFKQPETTADTVELEKIAPWQTDGAESRTEHSVKQLGAISAVTLRRLDKKHALAKEGYLYEVVDGARRLTDYVNNNIEKAPAVILDAKTSDKEFHAARFAANMARSNNMVHEAESMKETMNATGWTQSDLSEYFGIPLPTVSKTLKILELSPFWLTAVREGKIKGTVAFELVNLTDEQQEAAKKIFAETGTIKIKDIRGIRQTGKQKQAASLNGEAFTDGAGKYQKPLETPEARYEEAAKELYGSGLTREDLVAILERVEALIEEEAEEAAKAPAETEPAEA